jgi:DNA-binding transcriptional ArsR family regulator
MEPTDSRPAASLPSGLDSPTDPLICSLLAAEPMTSPEIAARLAIPARTVRHRLMRLRDAGAVRVGEDGIYRVEARAAWTLPAVAAPDGDPAAVSAMSPTGWNAAGLVALGAIAACCVGAAVLAARSPGGSQLPPAAPAARLGWPYGVGRLGPGSWY